MPTDSKPRPNAHGNSGGPRASAPVRLVDFVDVSLLQDLQDSFASLGRLSIQILDRDGRRITRPSCATPGCNLADTQRELCTECVAAAVRAIGESDPGQPPPAACDLGMNLLTAPIEGLGQRLGIVAAGGMPEPIISDARVADIAARYLLDPEQLRDALLREPTYRIESATRLPHVLARIITTLCEQRYEIRLRLKEISTICDVTGLLAGTGDLRDILNQTAAHVCRVMNVTAAALRLIAEDTNELVLQAAHNLSAEYLAKGTVTVADSPVDRTALGGETVYIEDVGTDPRVQYPDALRREGLVSCLCVPIAYRGDAVGVLRIYSDHVQHFSSLETGLLQAIGSQIAGAITHTRLYDQRRANERYRRQLAYAAEIQQRMISPLPAHRRITFGAVYDPRLEVSGDFYDFIDLPEGNLGLCIADVVGKGIPAALLMASVRTGLRAHADSIFDINDIMGRVNRGLHRDTLISEFVTLFYGVFRADGSQLTYCNAGHEPPLLLRGDDIFRLRTGGMVLGIDPGESYQMDVVDLRSGDILVMFTDGVTEAMNFDEEAYGRERVISSLHRHRDLAAPRIAQQLLWDVRRFAGLADKTDDQTLVVAKVN